MAWRPAMPTMRHDAPRAFGMGDRPLTYGAAPYGPPYTNVFRPGPPGVPTPSQYLAPSRPITAAFPSTSGAASSSTSATAAAASSSAKAAEVLAQQQAADDKKRGYPTIKGKSVAQCKRKSCGTEELKWLCDGRRLALNVDNTVKIFDALHHREGQEATLELTVPSTQICCHPTNDNLILTSSEDKCLRIWDVRTKRPAIVSQKFDYWSVGWNSDGSKIVGAREDSRKTVDVLEIVDARTLEPEQSECVTEGSCVFSLAWHPTVPDHFYSVTHKSSSMLPFITNIEMHQVTASGIIRRCTMPAHPEPCSYIDIQCDRLGRHMLTVSRDKDKDSDDRTDDCVIAIWDLETLVVLANIMDPDDYKNLTCSIQPKGGLIAVGGLSDIKIYNSKASITMRIDPSVSGIKRSVLATAWSPTEKPLLAYTCKDARDRDAHLCLAGW